MLSFAFFPPDNALLTFVPSEAIGKLSTNSLHQKYQIYENFAAALLYFEALLPRNLRHILYLIVSCYPFACDSVVI